MKLCALKLFFLNIANILIALNQIIQKPTMHTLQLHSDKNSSAYNMSHEKMILICTVFNFRD